MPEIKFSELPGNLRVQLTEDGREELWHRVDEFGGIKSLSKSFEFSQSKMYNWKNKELALPVKFVKRIMGENNTSTVILLKGKSSSGKIKSPVFPLALSGELLTRIEASSAVNSEGTPFYITGEISLLDRFLQLIGGLGSVDYEVYSRSSRYEVRYPKFLHDILSNLEYAEDMPALVDEKGEVREEKIVVEDKAIPVKGFDQKLFSREKSFELALQQGNSKKIANLIAEESAKVRRYME